MGAPMRNLSGLCADARSALPGRFPIGFCDEDIVPCLA